MTSTHRPAGALVSLKRRVIRRSTGATLAACLLSSCGGGGGGADNPAPEPPAQAIGGWVGDRTAWPQARVAFSCANGSTATATSSATGHYAAALPSGALPCLVLARATDGGLLWSAAVAASTANVTPLSTSVVTRALRTTPTLLFGSPTLARRLSPTLIAEAERAVDEATSGLDLGSAGAAITTPVGSNEALDPLVRANGRLMDGLTARGMTMSGWQHALSQDIDPTVLRTALAQADQRLLLNLPLVGAEATMPQLARDTTQVLAGSGSRALLLGKDLSFYSNDGGLHWQPLNMIFSQVIGYKGAVIGRGPGGLMRSTDGGVSWTKVESAPPAANRLEIGPDLRLWSLGDTDSASDDGLHWAPAIGDLNTHLAMLSDVYRSPPQRSVISDRQAQNRVRSCLAADCTIVDLGAPVTLQRVHGTDEVLASSALDGRMWISSNGLQWQPLGPFQAPTPRPVTSMLRLASGRLLAKMEGATVQASDDDGRTWQPLGPATANRDWQPVGSAAALRRDAAGGMELSVNGGLQWHKVPAGPSIRVREWHSPDGAMLRIVGLGDTGVVELSTDAGARWRVVISDTVEEVAWLGDRFGAVVKGELRTSRDGRQWATAGPLPEGNSVSAFTGADGVWAIALCGDWCTRTGPTLYESTDEGRSWKSNTAPVFSRSTRPMTCAGTLYLGDFFGLSVRRPGGWTPVTLPSGSNFAGCSNGLLTAVGGDQRTHSHHVSADQGATWIAIGRPSTELVFDGGRWWSIGEGSITLWPR
jgi:hypothetical protein